MNNNCIFEIRKEGDYKRLLFQGSPVGIRYRIVRRVNPRTILVGKDKYSLSCYYCKDDKLMYFPTSRLKIYPMYLIVKDAYIIYRTSFNKLYDTNISYIKYFDKGLVNIKTGALLARRYIKFSINKDFIKLRPRNTKGTLIYDTETFRKIL